jgi:hypothetical protein
MSKVVTTSHAQQVRALEEAAADGGGDNQGKWRFGFDVPSRFFFFWRFQPVSLQNFQLFARNALVNHFMFEWQKRNSVCFLSNCVGMFFPC